MNWHFLTGLSWRRGLAGLVLLLACSNLLAAEYVGLATCTSCHAGQVQQWHGSHHQLAMQVADEATVLGDFSGQDFTHNGMTTRFYRDGQRFMVRTDGPDGKLHDYPVSYTFGVYPLQQYLVEFPGGRLQALDIAWDSRPPEAGGQRWFALHPDEQIAAGDVLHWTGPNLNWNYMCADCHSTNLQKNYTAESDSYATRWTDINVACEACHGPASEHVSWANGDRVGEVPENYGLTRRFAERDGISWTIDTETGNAVRSAPRNTQHEIEVCAACHSRRTQIAENDAAGSQFHDAFLPAWLETGLYHADGQILDEVYVYGSFLQSRMYAAGVTCSDCHDPHSTELRQPGDQVCQQCHAPQRFASREHHHHEPGSNGASCVGCHMPARNFMVVDARNDHSFRIPRPDLSVKLGTPNACNQCHVEKSALWAAQQLQAWGVEASGAYQQFAEALHAGRRHLPAARQLLNTLAADSGQPAIARASALALLGDYVDRATLDNIRSALQESDPMLRRAALEALQGYDARSRITLAFPLLDDPVRGVRMQAGRLLAAFPAGDLPADKQALLQNAIDEYIAAQQFNAERPESQVNLGALYADLGRPDAARQAYQQALQLQPRFVPAYVNLAQLESDGGEQVAAIALLRKGIDKVPESAELQHALGLALVRQKSTTEAVAALQRATELAPENARYGYVYAVALNSTGQPARALQVLQATYEKHPGNTDVLFALVTFNRDAGQNTAALRYLDRLRELLPGDVNLQRLDSELRQAGDSQSR